MLLPAEKVEGNKKGAARQMRLFLKRHLIIPLVALAIGNVDFASLPKLLANDLDAAVDAFDSNLGKQRLELDGANADDEPVKATMPQQRGGVSQASATPSKANSVTHLDEAIRINPTSAVGYNNRGRAYQSLRDYDKALSDYSQAIQLDPHLLLPITIAATPMSNKENTTGR